LVPRSEKLRNNISTNIELLLAAPIYHLDRNGGCDDEDHVGSYRFLWEDEGNARRRARLRCPLYEGFREAASRSTERRLFTATLEVDDSGEFAVRMFHGCHAVDEAEVLDGLAQRVPISHLAQVRVRPGIDGSNPVVRHLVPALALATLVTLGDCCPHRRPLAMGGVIQITEGMG
jgi:hypothetical protein